MAITAAMVKELREMTGAGMMEIIEPEAVREEMRGLALHILKFYDKP